jgi:hypothetical protein
MNMKVLLGGFALSISTTVALAQSPAQTSDDNWIDEPALYPAFVQSVNSFFGNSPGSYIEMGEFRSTMPAEQRTLLARQFLFAASGAPFPEAELPDGYRLMARHKAHDGHVFGIVIMQGQNTQIVAAALFHYYCGRNNALGAKSDPAEVQPGCDSTPTLTIFHKQESPQNLVTGGYIKDWVRRTNTQRYSAHRWNVDEVLQSLLSQLLHVLQHAFDQLGVARLPVIDLGNDAQRMHAPIGFGWITRKALVGDVRIVLEWPCRFHQVDVPRRLGSSQGYCKFRRQARSRRRQRGEVDVVGEPTLLIVRLEPGAEQRSGLQLHRGSVIEGAANVAATVVAARYPVRIRTDLHGLCASLIHYESSTA